MTRIRDIIEASVRAAQEGAQGLALFLVIVLLGSVQSVCFIHDCLSLVIDGSQVNKI